MFDVPQTDVSVDKIVLEPLSEILLHLIRNALDHGIEFSSERIEKSKNEFVIKSCQVWLNKKHRDKYGEKHTDHLIFFP